MTSESKEMNGQLDVDNSKLASQKPVPEKKQVKKSNDKRKSTGSKVSKATKNGGTSTTRSISKKTAYKRKINSYIEKNPEGLVYGLDIGTRSIVGTVGIKNDSGDFVVLAQNSLEHKTRAMLDGQIHDIDTIAKELAQVTDTLKDLTGLELKSVCIAAAGRVLKTIQAEAQITFDTQTVITKEHVYSLDMLAIENAYDILHKENENTDMKFYCVGYSVVHYYQNDYPITNLEGHKAVNIKTELIATFLPDEVVDGLYASAQRAGLRVANLTLEPIAAMNAAIPEKFRLLNIALVDVGAGTSDISITKDGSIIAYGMIPSAGDEITECISKTYLVDFNEAERLKCACTDNETVTYHDIMDIEHEITRDDIGTTIKKTITNITEAVAKKIIELNGNKPVSAVFVVGGGGKAVGFTDELAEKLGLSHDRVALRGKEVLKEIEFVQNDIVVDSLLVTPVGICLNYYEQRNNFIFVNINKESIKLYDNSRLTVMDAALQTGFPNSDLFPKRGEALNYTVNGQKRMLRGEPGEPAIVLVNGRESSLSEKLNQNDQIEIVKSTEGERAVLRIDELPEYKDNVIFTFNEKKIQCPKFAQVNDRLVLPSYEICDGDSVNMLDYYTVKQVMVFMDIPNAEDIMVNNMPATQETKVYDNFTITCSTGKFDELGMSKTVELEKTEAKDIYVEETLNNVISAPEETGNEVQKEEVSVSDHEKFLKEKIKNLNENSDNDIQKPVVNTQTSKINITVNDTPVEMKGKDNYKFVDILDFYPFDTSVARGDKLIIELNGTKCEFTTPLKANDTASIYWS